MISWNIPSYLSFHNLITNTITITITITVTITVIITINRAPQKEAGRDTWLGLFTNLSQSQSFISELRVTTNFFLGSSVLGKLYHCQCQY